MLKTNFESHKTISGCLEVTRSGRYACSGWPMIFKMLSFQSPMGMAGFSWKFRGSEMVLAVSEPLGVELGVAELETFEEYPSMESTTVSRPLATHTEKRNWFLFEI